MIDFTFIGDVHMINIHAFPPFKQYISYLFDTLTRFTLPIMVNSTATVISFCGMCMTPHIINIQDKKSTPNAFSHSSTGMISTTYNTRMTLNNDTQIDTHASSELASEYIEGIAIAMRISTTPSMIFVDLMLLVGSDRFIRITQKHQYSEFNIKLYIDIPNK